MIQLINQLDYDLLELSAQMNRYIGLVSWFHCVWLLLWQLLVNELFQFANHIVFLLFRLINQ